MYLARTILLHLALVAAFASPLLAEKPAAGEAIRLSQIQRRHWLLTPEGQPFFAHGITHAGNNRAKFDFKDFSKACKEVGFNAYGYGCPEQLRKDMPFLGWNHLVPISYRGRNGVKFIDVFDPKVQNKLKNGVRANCIRSRDNPNWLLLDGPRFVAAGKSLGRNWVDFIRDLPEDAGRKAYQKFLSVWKGGDGQAALGLPQTHRP